MTRRILCLLLLITFTSVCLAGEEHLLWYKQPASKWTEALPLGNGRLGAMVFGSVPIDRFQLNEESLWAGEPFDVYPDNFSSNLKIFQQLILEGKIPEARAFGIKNLTKKPTSFRSYQPLGDLWIELDHGKITEHYRHELDIRSGIDKIRYKAGNKTFTRESFISAVDDILAIRLICDKKKGINCKIRLTREKDAMVTALENGVIRMDGQIIDIPAPEAYDDNPGGSGPGGKHMRFACRLVIRTNGHITAEKDTLKISEADEIELLLTGTTDFSLQKMNFDRSIDPGSISDNILKKASTKSWQDLYTDHLKEHRSIFDRVAINLGDPGNGNLPTDQRLNKLKNGATDPGLVELYFQFGRYLLMNSSRRPGRIPANLQGIWNHHMWAPWEADFHLNINLQMNYWPTDVTNLSECMESLTDWFENVTEKGKTSARRLYNADGWVAFLSVSLFGRTSPAGSTIESQYKNSVLDPLAGAWMAITLWRHYEFNGSMVYLQEHAYPVLKGASAFLRDYLYENKEGYLVIVPSTSPENAYIQPETGEAVRLTQGSAYHMSIVREVFKATIAAANILEKDMAFRDELNVALNKIPSLKIGKDGTIQEWWLDYEEALPGHRHISHLLGLHPFAQITPHTPELFVAAKETIKRRLSFGGGHTGWSRAWIINFYARLLDGNDAHRHLELLLQKSTLPNLFDTHPPFQIDGNFGGTAGIAEMLLQSQTAEIHLLPALPNAWPDGYIRGLKARKGFIVDIKWENGVMIKGDIYSILGHICRIRSNQLLKVTVDGHPIDSSSPENSVIQFDTEIGKSYQLHVKK